MDVQEIHRKDTLCAQTVMSKADYIVVPDLTKDPRFYKNVTVVGPPYLKFYAAAPLVSPEGYRLGTLCVIDYVVRPRGLSEEQIKTLVDLADMAIKVMVDRRTQLMNETVKPIDPVEMLASMAHDIVAPLTGIQFSLSRLGNDSGVKSSLNEQHLDLLTAAASSSDLVVRICQNALNELRRLEVKDAKGEEPDSTVSHEPITITSEPNATRLDILVQSLRLTIDPLPKDAPCFITLDQSAPNDIVADDLKLFRSALNLLTYAVKRTETGAVHLSIRADRSDLLMFECEDTGPDISVEEYSYLFQSNDKSRHRDKLSSVATLVDTMDGEYGFRPRGIDSDGNVLRDTNGCRRSGSIFWFSIPLVQAGSSAFVHESTTSDGASYSPLPMSHFRQASTSVPQEGAKIQAIGSTISVRELVSEFGAETTYGTTDDGGEAMLNLLATKMMPASAGYSQGDESLAAMLGQLHDIEPNPIVGVPVPNARARRRRVLVIDDSMVVRRDLILAVTSLGYDAAEAANGMEGLAEMQRLLFDVVFCDFAMPEMDGLTCVSQFREWEMVNRPWDRQLIVGISEHPELNNRGQGLQAGMDMFYPKPVTVKIVSEIQVIGAAVLRSEKLDQLETGLRQSRAVSTESSAPSEPPSSFRYNAGGEGVASANSMLHAHAFTIPGPLANAEAAAPPPPTCLLATCVRMMQPDPFPKILESKGWKVITVNNGLDCLKLLQVRTWDAVLIDDALPQLAGMACITTFRQWEAKSRTGDANTQRNVFLVCDGYVPPPWDKQSAVQPPNGCNGVLGRPIPLNDFEFLLQTF
jgi:CheY-like chemotaxis protein